ncbi:hypothetical protein X279_06540 [Oenococcus oeni IOEB_0501]|nr:hypothetical protein X279_09030 [Oenococcus oeni IOEB_0501]KEP87527.1 hypothetical protein X279_06540 [Oenococcus oeni IOEB_0501]
MVDTNGLPKVSNGMVLVIGHAIAVSPSANKDG